MKDNIRCRKIDGKKSYWNPEQDKCTVEKSNLCELKEDGEPGKLPSIYIFFIQKLLMKINPITNIVKWKFLMQSAEKLHWNG